MTADSSGWRDAVRRVAALPGLIWRVARRDGLRVTTGATLARAGERLMAGSRPAAIDARAADVLAPIGHPPVSPPVAGSSGSALTINWIVNPPTEQSGGMQTLMRVISLLESRGHDCRIYVLYKGLQRDLDAHREIARQRFPSVRASIEDVSDGMRAADAVFATAWPTAYVARAATAPGARFYLVQDFEPAFYPASSNAILAEETYRFGFHGLTAGPWLSTKLRRDYGMSCDSFDLGVDLEIYRFDEAARRSGVVFYARPDTPRRGFELGMMALELLARRQPEIEIHLVGQPIRWRHPGFAFVDHGHLAPTELAALYQSCAAGLVLSLTNLSLLPNELLAAGCIPVMNDAENTRASCDNPCARFAGALPDQLADELCSVIEAPDAAEIRAAAAAHVARHSWEHVADQLESGLRRGLQLATQGATFSQGPAGLQAGCS